MTLRRGKTGCLDQPQPSIRLMSASTRALREYHRKPLAPIDGTSLLLQVLVISATSDYCLLTRIYLVAVHFPIQKQPCQASLSPLFA